MTKDEALRMAIDGLEIHQQDILDACKEALEQPVEVVASGQPFNFKEKKYLYVYKGQGYQYNLSSEKYATGSAYMGAYIGKIEVQDD